MEREAFIKAMEEAPEECDTEWITEVIVNNRSASGNTRLMHIAIEELAELAKELTKELRGIGDRTAVLEEYADVQIVLDHMQLVFGFTYEEIQKAQYVKFKRIEDKLKSDGVYQ
jgi:predicted house-cleaning noncanonical NTP pyrophosphatase (MazG superfamily)